MTDREKVIKGLKCCLANGHNNCPYKSTDEGIDKVTSCTTYLMQDSLALLEAQEPRVMSFGEALGAEVNVDQCWLEVKGIKQIYLADAVVCPEHVERADIQRWGANDCQLPLDLYGAYWRMWTSEPTQEQREAVKWE